MQQKKLCLRCLLDAADEKELAALIRKRVAALPDEQKADPQEYSRRLSLCMKCDELIGGSCRKCGCFVELRAAKNIMYCPHENPKW